MTRQYAVLVERNIRVPMRDGARLSCDVYRPRGVRSCPVLVQRTPYGKSLTRNDLDPLRAASEGYIVVMQDVRGRGASEGRFYPFRYEKDDGYDTIEWAAALPGSNGKVGMFGGSYMGATQWLAALAQPPHLTAIFPSKTAADFYDGWAYRSGVLQLLFVVSWLLSPLAIGSLERLTLGRRRRQAILQQLLRLADDPAQVLLSLPLAALPCFQQRGLVPYYHDWLAHFRGGRYWEAWSIERHHRQIALPACSLGAWYDIFLDGTLRNYLGMSRSAGSLQARRHQHLVVGPWNHVAPQTSLVGEMNFGLRAAGPGLGAAGPVADIGGLHLRWYDHWLKNRSNGVDREPPVKLFVMGENLWRDEREWPLARTQYTPVYLHSRGHANSQGGDGALSFIAPSDESPDTFLYDPRNPVPTRGGGLCCTPVAPLGGPFDQSSIERRPDVLVYTSSPLEDPLEVTGPLKVVLWVSTSAPDTDFTAKLVDVHPGGFAQNVADGIVRLSVVLGSPRPHRVHCLEIGLVATSNVFLPGHRVCLEISSSNFPRFDRNHNTGQDFPEDDELLPALQTVYHDHRRSSHIVLPIIPRQR